MVKFVYKFDTHGSVHLWQALATAGHHMGI